jgi:hypothetical protein
MFANDSDCTNQTNGIILNGNGNSDILGNIQSNSNLGGSAKGNESFGNGSYGPPVNGTCGNYVTYKGHNPWNSPPTAYPTDVPFPIDYSQDFPACGGSGTGACQTSGASAGYPPFCTNSGANVTLTGTTSGDYVATNNIYCASGNGKKSDPSTWNGTITIALSGKNVLYDTFVGGSISFTGTGNDTLSSCGYALSGYTPSSNCPQSVPSPVTTNYPIFYATGTDCGNNYPLDVYVRGSQTLNGDMFVPNGTASLDMNGNKTLTTLIEANDISASIGGTFQGDGPTANNTGSSSSGNVQLTQ